jgi:hypothetical protein
MSLTDMAHDNMPTVVNESCQASNLDPIVVDKRMPCLSGITLDTIDERLDYVNYSQ